MFNKRYIIIFFCFSLCINLIGCGFTETNNESQSITKNQVNTERKDKKSEIDTLAEINLGFYNNEHNDLKKWYADNKEKYDLEPLEITLEKELKILPKDVYGRYLYVGESSNKRPNGKGVIYRNDDGKRGEVLYVGNFENGFPKGYGEYYKNGKIMLLGNLSDINLTEYNSKIGEMKNAIIFQRFNNITRIINNDIKLYITQGVYSNAFDNEVDLGYSFAMNENGESSFSVFDNYKKAISYDKNKGLLEVYRDSGILKYRLENMPSVFDSSKQYIVNGESFDENGKLLYKGEFLFRSFRLLLIDGNKIRFSREGKGTSYKADGSVDYNGEWENNTFK